MPRTKLKPESPSATPSLSGRNGPTGDVLSLSEAAAYLRLPEQEVLRLVHEQALPARQAGSEWRFWKEAIQGWLSQPFTKPKEDFWEASIGAWKDDPQADEIVKAISKRGGRSAIEKR
jgi:excisionase family DNA binding protein